MARRVNRQPFLPKGTVITVLDAEPRRAIVVNHCPSLKLMLVRFRDYGTCSERLLGTRDYGQRWVVGYLDTPESQCAVAEHLLLG